MSKLTTKELAKIEIIDRLPSFFGSGVGVPRELIGATIHRIGTPKTLRLFEGGGLVIDFTPSGSTARKRVVLALNDLGMWIEDILTLEAPTLPSVEESRGEG